MRTYTRVIFGLNAIYQLLVGLLAIGAPAMMIQMYGADAAHQADPVLSGVIRDLGANILLAAVVSAMIARDPDRYPVLLPVMGILSVLVVLAEVGAMAMGEMTLGQIGLDVVVQAAILVAVIGYRSAWTASAAAA